MLQSIIHNKIPELNISYRMYIINTIEQFEVFHQRNLNVSTLSAYDIGIKS